MPGDIRVKKASEITSPSGPQSDGMERIPAIVDMSDQICGTGRRPQKELHGLHMLIFEVMLAKPHSASAVHHHGEEGMILTFCNLPRAQSSIFSANVCRTTWTAGF